LILRLKGPCLTHPSQRYAFRRGLCLVRVWLAIVLPKLSPIQHEPRMSTATLTRLRTPETVPADVVTHAHALREHLGLDLAIVDAERCETLATAGLPGGNWGAWEIMCRAVAHGQQAEILADEDSFFVFAAPLGRSESPRYVAVGYALTRPFSAELDFSGAVRSCDVTPAEIARWAQRQTAYWSPTSLLRTINLWLKNAVQTEELRKLKHDVESLSVNLAETYEEVSLFHRLTQCLRLSCRDEELAELVIYWLAGALPFESILIQLLPLRVVDETTGNSPTSKFISRGPCRLTCEQFDELTDLCARGVQSQPVVLNEPGQQIAGWSHPEIRQLILVPLVEGDRLFGWLAAINHTDNCEFGTVEASMLASVAAILGIHVSNGELYRQQEELLAGMVKALTSAIDAKDPYTCGHSDRVARVAVRLGKELDLPPEELKAIYLGGLLHDVGKIGIDQDVLHKPGKLSPSEFEHIQTHTQIGYRILNRVPKLGHVVPIVLYHHEAWDGHGYPAGLAGENIPFWARIVSVADAYDAMSSDRPYRKGMPDEKLDEVIRNGAGNQWDERVVAAYFACRDDIRRISEQPSEEIRFDAGQWS